MAVQSDVGYFLTELANSLKGHKPDISWIQTLRAREDAREEELVKVSEHCCSFTNVNLNFRHETLLISESCSGNERTFKSYQSS